MTDKTCSTCAFWDTNTVLSLADSEASVSGSERAVCNWDNQGHVRYDSAWCRQWAPITGELEPSCKEPLLAAPCIFCQYSGLGYWQIRMHELNCPWHNVEGSKARERLLRKVIIEQNGILRVIGGSLKKTIADQK